MKIFKSSVRISVDFDNSVEILNGEDFSIPRRGLDAKIFENVDFVHVKFLRILYYQMWVSKCLKKNVKIFINLGYQMCPELVQLETTHSILNNSASKPHLCKFKLLKTFDFHALLLLNLILLEIKFVPLWLCIECN